MCMLNLAKKQKIFLFVLLVAFLFALCIIVSPPYASAEGIDVSSYFDYLGTFVPEDDALSLSRVHYENLDNVLFGGLKGSISFQSANEYITSCEWTSLYFYSEEQFRHIAEQLEDYYGYEPEITPKKYGNGNTYEYSWIDPYSNLTVLYKHGDFRYDPEGEIFVRWEINEKSCEKAGHEWADAACSTAKSCLICGATDGQPLGHNPGEWGEWSVDYRKGINIREQCCNMCGATIKEEHEELLSYVEGDVFSLYPAAFSYRFDDAFNYISGYSFESDEYIDENDYLFEGNTLYIIKSGDRDVGMYTFSKADGSLTTILEGYTPNYIKGINIQIKEQDDVAPVVYAAILALNPNIDPEEEEEVYNGIFEHFGNMEGATYNSITYVLYKANGYPGNYNLIITATQNEETKTIFE